ncbi:MAG: signal peptidase I [candidate division Zixibacteria bacterium]|nr:signal peptidase I [candidate division Zixibacteria bacterium]
MANSQAFNPKKKKKINSDINISKKWQNTSWEFIKALGTALILALIIKASVVEAYVIPSGSMENTLYAGDYIVGNKFVYGMKLPIPFTDIRLPSIDEPKPNDIVIFKYPHNLNQNYIKRVVAIEGQIVEIRDKEVYVDGKHVPLPIEGKHADKRIIPPQNPPEMGMTIRDNMPAIKVPMGKLFVMGDNRDNSADSRFWGFLDRKLVIGRAMLVLWSWEYQKPPPISTGAFSAVELWLYNIKHFPELAANMRWDRLGKITN